MAWTPERKAAFLAALRAHGGNLSAAAAEVTPHSSTQAQPGYTSAKYAMRADPSFALAVEEVREHVKADLYAVIYDMAINGTEEAVYQKGARVFEPVLDSEGEPVLDSEGKPKMRPASHLRRDWKLITRILGHLDPDWQERRTVDITHRKAGTVTLELADLAELDHDDRQHLTRILTKVREARSGQQRAITYEPMSASEPIEDADYEVIPAGEAQNATAAPLEAWEGLD